MKIKIFENEVKTFYLNSNSHLPKKKNALFASVKAL